MGKKMEKDKEEISLEDLIEKERANLDTSKLTKVTLETFVAWKKKKLKEKKEKEKKGTVSGRDLFLKDPAMLARHVEEDDDGTKVHEIKFDEYGIMDDGVDESTDVQLARARGEEVPDGATAAPAVDVDEDLFDDDDLDDLEGDLDALDI